MRKYRLIQFLRKFYFIKTVLLQVLIEGNVVYFTYVCFGHLSTSFSFQFGDKVSLLFTVVFLFAVVVFTFTFYPLVGHFLEEKAGYFMYCYYRCNSGYLLLSTKNLIRNFLRGAVFYFLHEFYLEELLLLSVIEVLVMIILVVWESTAGAFVSKVFYCLELICNFLFVLLNFTLYFGYAAESIYFDEGLKELALGLQEMVIYLLIATALLLLLFDLVPLEWLKKSSFIELLIKKEPKVLKSEKNEQRLKSREEAKNNALTKNIFQNQPQSKTGEKVKQVGQNYLNINEHQSQIRKLNETDRENSITQPSKLKNQQLISQEIIEDLLILQKTKSKKKEIETQVIISEVQLNVIKSNKDQIIICSGLRFYFSGENRND